MARVSGRPVARRRDAAAVPDASDLFPYGAGATAATATRGVAVERHQPADLAEILERVLNTGIVIAGEIRIDLLDIELLTIKIRLVITSLDRAEEVGLDWWRSDPWYSAEAPSDSHFSETEDRGSGSDSGRSGGSDTDGRDDGDESSPPSSSGAAGRGSGSRLGESSVYAEEVVTLSASAAKPKSSRAAVKKSAAKKSAAKKSAAKKSAAKKSAAKKSAAKKSAGKKSAGKKSAGKKSAAKKQSSGSASSGD